MISGTFPTRAALVGPLVVLAGIAAASAQGPTAQDPFAVPGFELERKQAVHTLASGATVRLTQRFGDTRLRFGGYEGVVELQAVVQQFADEGPRLELRIAASGPDLIVEVGWRDAAGEELRLEPVAGQRKRADLVLFIPKAVRVEMVGGDGLIDARGLQSDLTVRASGSEVMVRTIKGDLDLETTSGTITAVPGVLDRQHEQRFVSVSGDVTLMLFEQGHFDVEARTEGLLSTDFSLEVERDPARPSRKRGRARVGKGTTPIEVASTTGHLRLVRKPSAAEALRPDPDERP